MLISTLLDLLILKENVDTNIMLSLQNVLPFPEDWFNLDRYGGL